MSIPVKLPKYASKANINQLVKVLCKGKCGKTRWAEIQEPNPGLAKLKKSQVGDYHAKCLYCEKIAQDPYNWYV